MTNFKDITFIISDFKHGGTQKVLSQIIGNLQNRNILLIILGETRQFNKKNVKLVKLNLQRKTKGIFDAIKNNLKILRMIRNKLKRTNSKNVISFIFETNILTILSSIGLKKKVIISERNNPFFQKKNIIWNILRNLIYPFADLIVVNSHFAYDYYNKFISSKKLVYLENSIVIKRKKLKKKKNIIVASSLTKQKSIETIIKAFALFNKKNKNWRLLIAGEGPEEINLKLLAEKENLANKIDWLGFEKNLENIFRSSTIFCLPSNYEGMSNSLLEGLSYDLPCVVSDSVVHCRDPLKKFVITFRRNDHLDLFNKLDKVKDSKLNVNNKFFEFAKSELNPCIINKKWEDLLT